LPIYNDTKSNAENLWFKETVRKACLGLNSIFLAH